MPPEMRPDWPSKRPCKIAFVAEAPADEEMLAGIPLVGKAGRMYNSLLRMAGIDRSEVLTTNVFDTQLPGNEIANWCITTRERNELQKSKDGYDLPAVFRGKWLDPRYEWHLDRLAGEIAACKPNIIVPLGGVALWAFTGWSGIEARRGAVCEASMTVPGAKLLPTFHPAAILRQYQLLFSVVKDLLKAKRESESPEISYTKRTLFVAETVEDIEGFQKEHLEGAAWTSIDIETLPAFRQITCISFAPDESVALTVPFVDERQPDRSYWRTAEEEVRAWQAVKCICEMPNPKIGQNFDYDFRWLYDVGIGVKNAEHDTRLMHHALYPELPKDLGFLGSVYARSEAAWKTYRPRKSEKRDE